MHDIKKKLVGILQRKPYNMSEVSAGRLADHLIANGVTVQQWISVEERLPEDNDEKVLVIANGKPHENITLVDAYELAVYSAEDGWIIEEWPEWEGANVTHWMPLPEPPKED